MSPLIIFSKEPTTLLFTNTEPPAAIELPGGFLNTCVSFLFLRLRALGAAAVGERRHAAARAERPEKRALALKACLRRNLCHRPVRVGQQRARAVYPDAREVGRKALPDLFREHV